MDFLKKRVKQYQKKLDDALSKIKFHSDMKIQLEHKIVDTNHDQNSIRKEILSHNKMIKIWEKMQKKLKEK
ncbi:MAG: hypothetical protein ACRBB5_09030 [Nitrosopumilus sp.]